MIQVLAIGDAGSPSLIRNRMARAIVKTSPKDAVLMLGDNFYEYGISSENEDRWHTDFENVFHPTCPWLAILGNHDYLGNPQAQVTYSYVKPATQWTMPARYYDKKLYFDKKSGDGDGVHIFCLDTFDLSPSESALNTRAMSLTSPFLWNRLSNGMKDRAVTQLEWLDRSLASSTMTWKIVAGHYPIFSGGGHGDNPELIARLKPILDRHRVNLYLCGHDHDLQHIVKEDMHYIVSGTGSRYHPLRDSSRNYDVIPRSTGVSFMRFFKTHALIGFTDETSIFYEKTILPRSSHVYYKIGP